jgi:hypothetical protein
MSFDEQPDGDPHGECRLEIETMQKTARQYAARVRDFEIAATALRTVFRRYQKRDHSDAHVLLPALGPLFKLLTPVDGGSEHR